MKHGKTILAVRIDTDGRREEITATISPGHRTGSEDIGICDVDCPAIFDRVHQIAGVDETQAMTLGYRFLRIMLEHEGFELIDDDPLTR